MNNDKWNSLSLKEKSEIMKIAISSGVRDLNSIRKSYNSFAEGGQTDKPRGVEEKVKEDDLNGIINFGLTQVSKILDSNLIPESTKNRVIELVMRLSGGTSSMETASNVAKFLTTKEGLVALKNVVFTNDKVDNIVQSALNASQAPYVGNYTGFALPSDILDPDVESFIDEHPRDSDFVDSYIRGTTPFESAGVTKVDNDDPTRLGRYEQYIKDNYKGRHVNTYQGHRDTIPQELVRELNEKSHRKETRTFGMHDTDLAFPFGEKEKGKVQGYYDAAGYNLELVEGSDGKTYGRISDMYDFLPRDYVKQYNKEGSKGLSNIINSIDNVGHPFIFRSPWFDPQAFGVPEDLIEHFKNTK